MCEKVIVKEGDAPDAKMFYFPCGKWFDTSAEDGEIVREILPGEPPKDSRELLMFFSSVITTKQPVFESFRSNIKLYQDQISSVVGTN